MKNNDAKRRIFYFNNDRLFYVLSYSSFILRFWAIAGFLLIAIGIVPRPTKNLEPTEFSSYYGTPKIKIREFFNPSFYGVCLAPTKVGRFGRVADFSTALADISVSMADFSIGQGAIVGTRT